MERSTKIFSQKLTIRKRSLQSWIQIVVQSPCLSSQTAPTLTLTRVRNWGKSKHATSSVAFRKNSDVNRVMRSRGTPGSFTAEQEALVEALLHIPDEIHSRTTNQTAFSLTTDTVQKGAKEQKVPGRHDSGYVNTLRINGSHRAT